MTNEEAKIALANLKRYMSGGGVIDRETNKAIDMAIDALGKSEPHWIPVTERLPIECDNPTEFLCTLELKYKNSVVRYVDLIMWNGSDWENNYIDDNKYSDYGIDKVVAWMPKPEPYKEVTE